MNIYTIHIQNPPRPQDIALKLKEIGCAGILLSFSSALVSTDLGLKELADKLGYDVFIFCQFSSGWHYSKSLNPEIHDKIQNILNSGPATVHAA